MKCQKCNSERIFFVQAKHSDTLIAENHKKECYEGYNIIGINNLDNEGSDYLSLDYCLECGQIQGEWPCPDPDLSV